MLRIMATFTDQRCEQLLFKVSAPTIIIVRFQIAIVFLRTRK